MKIAIGSDHAGFALKESVKKHLEEVGGFEIADLGTYDTKSVTFRVVNAMAVATGDESPIGLIVGVALAALAVIIAAVVFLVIRRRRR